MKNQALRICQFSSVHTRKDVRVFYKQCIHLVELGYEVHLVLADGLGSCTANGVRIHDLGKAQNRLIRMLFVPLAILIKLLSLKCRINHFHDPELLPIALLFKWISGSLLIYDVHESYPEDFLQKEYLPLRLRPLLSTGIDRFELWAASHFDAVIPATSHIAERFNTLSIRQITLKNYPRLSEFGLLASSASDETPVEKHGRSFCYIGNITRQRGLAQLVKAINTLDCSFDLAGNYEPQSFRTELTSLPGWKKVTEHGFVNRAEAQKLIRQSQFGAILLLPLPNHIHALPTKAFEYMAGGIAVLVPDFPIWKELVEANGCGICVNPLDTQQIAVKIDYLLSHPELAASMGEKGRSLVATTYNWEAEAPTYPPLSDLKPILKSISIPLA